MVVYGQDFAGMMPMSIHKPRTRSLIIWAALIVEKVCDVLKICMVTAAAHGAHILVDEHHLHVCTANPVAHLITCAQAKLDD